MEDHLSGETGVALIAADGRWTLVRGVRLLTSLAADVKTDDTILEHANAALRGHASSFKHTRADGRVYSCQLLPLAHGDAAFIITDISAQLAMRESARLQLGADLHCALAREEFDLNYQPQFDVENGLVVSAEALLRWQRRGEKINPEVFIPLAERSGLIVSLGAWALARAANQAQTWQRQGPVRVAVNVSPTQLLHDDFVADVEAVLAKTGLTPSLLELEITESALALAHENCARKTLGALKGLGLHLTIDDFGTGYSSLARLQQFPFDSLKIDRSFVQEVAVSERAQAIVRAIIGLAHALGLTVLAEGVENARQHEFLVSEGCDMCSGWLFAPALSAQKFDEFISRPR
jgi:EAL domain-containing protein (putative c-di-GMP-specific phosphodiesterase class I)